MTRDRRPDNEKRTCLLETVITWLGRAITGRHDLLSLPDPIEVDDRLIQERTLRPKEMKDRIEDLDREMKYRGLRPIQNFWRRGDDR